MYLLINAQDQTSAATFKGVTGDVVLYLFTADSLTSSRVMVNGIELGVSPEGVPYMPKGVAVNYVVLPPHSYAFVCAYANNSN